ncbi:hypothetical protein GCM10023205_47730 [Yinghuangia aomiensis]|uniref:ABC3 transporter permease C-terminal domain-containing protein n=2 Tax=Yinghuangia aomiensis TaxID=676205 RepID=A0ABP9HPD8_9ACTN
MTFAGLAAAVFVVAAMLGYAVRQRELVLLRAVGATPLQVRRIVRVQAAAVVAATSPGAWAAGAYGARWFVHAPSSERAAGASAQMVTGGRVVPGRSTAGARRVIQQGRHVATTL